MHPAVAVTTHHEKYKQSMPLHKVSLPFLVTGDRSRSSLYLLSTMHQPLRLNNLSNDWTLYLPTVPCLLSMTVICILCSEKSAKTCVYGEMLAIRFSNLAKVGEIERAALESLYWIDCISLHRLQYPNNTFHSPQCPCSVTAKRCEARIYLARTFYSSLCLLLSTQIAVIRRQLVVAN